MIGFLVFAIIVILIQNIYHYAQNGDFFGDQDPEGYAFVTEGFGPITYPEISSLSIQEGSKPSFSISGQFSKSPTSVNVYKVNKPRESLGNSKRAQEVAGRLYFTSSNYELEDNVLTWRSNNKQILQYNKLTNNMTYSNEGINIAELRSEKPEFVDSEAIDKIINEYMTVFNSSTAQFSEEEITNYLLSDGNKYKTTTIAENADFIRTDFALQKEVVSLRASELEENTTGAEAVQGNIYLDNPKQGSLHIIVANSSSTQIQVDSNDKSNSKIREYGYINIDISEEKSVYSLRTYEEAWQDVQEGRGYLKYLIKQGTDPLADYTPLNVKRFIVDPDKSRLGLYAPGSWTGYLYPIYVFEGIAELSDGSTADFVFYARAIN